MYNKKDFSNYEDPFSSSARVIRSIDSGYASPLIESRNRGFPSDTYASATSDNPMSITSGNYPSTRRTITVTKIPAASPGFVRGQDSEDLTRHGYNNGPSYIDDAHIGSSRSDNPSSYRSMVVTQVGGRGGHDLGQLGGRGFHDDQGQFGGRGIYDGQGQDMNNYPLQSPYGAREHDAPFPPYAPDRRLPQGASSRLVYSMQPTNQTVVRSKPFNPSVSPPNQSPPHDEIGQRSFRTAGLQDPRPYQLKPTMDPNVPMGTRETSSGLSGYQQQLHSSGKEAEVDALTDLLMQNMQMAGDPDFFGMCARCGRSIMGENTGCTALDQLFHIECFRCVACNTCLRGHPFYAMEGKPYCEGCYMSTLEKCSVCSKPITDRMLRATGKPYHPSCFTCIMCGKNLDGVSFTVDASSQTYCIEDFHRKFAPRCCACLQPIMPSPGKDEAIRIVALDRSFHVSCYRCEDCNLQLSSEAEGRGCYPLDEHILCKACNAKRIQTMTTKPITDL